MHVVFPSCPLLLSLPSSFPLSSFFLHPSSSLPSLITSSVSTKVCSELYGLYLQVFFLALTEFWLHYHSVQHIEPLNSLIKCVLSFSSLLLSFFLSLSVCICIHIFIFLSPSLLLCLSISLSFISLFFFLFSCISISLPLSPSEFFCIYLPVFLYLYLSLSFYVLCRFPVVLLYSKLMILIKIDLNFYICVCIIKSNFSINLNRDL